MKTSNIEFSPTNIVRIRELTNGLNDDQIALSIFFKLIPDLFCIADKTGYLKRTNPAWYKTLGWLDNELLAIPFLKFVHPDDIERTENVMRSMVDSDVVRFHNRYRRKPGSVNLTEGKSVAGDNDYVVLEWNATAWHDGLTYAVARQVPVTCLKCPDAEDRFDWIHRGQKYGIKD